MSSKPGSFAGIVSQLLGVEWRDSVELDEAIDACEELIKENPELKRVCQKINTYYYDEWDNRGYEPSWREFRNYTGIDVLEDRFDVDELWGDLEKKIDNLELTDK